MYGNVPERIDKSYIFSRISEEDIFYKYMGIYPNTTDFFVNPFRTDTHADCKFYRDNRGVLKFNDFAYKWNVDCFNVVQHIYKDSYPQALERVFRDFNLANIEPNFNSISNIIQVETSKDSTFLDIKVQRKDFTKWELDLWSSWGYSMDTLKLFNIGSLLRLWIRDKLIYTYNSKDPGFVYYFGNNQDGMPIYKIYFPLRDKYRFLQNAGDILQGYSQLPETGDFLLITKSYKDVGCIFNYQIPSVAPMGETVLITPEQFEDLNNRFFKIFTLFDRDRAGMIASKLYQKTYGTTPLLFDSTSGGLFRKKDEPKDFVDHHVVCGPRELIDMIDYVKDTYL